jgi:hypothetical protein
MPTRYRTNATVLALAVGVEAYLNVHPLITRNPLKAISPGAAVLITGQKAPATQLETNNDGNIGKRLVAGVYRNRFIRLIGDGVTTTWTATNFPDLANLHDDAGALTNTNKLRTVLLANNQITARKQSNVALTGGDFRTVNNAGIMEIQAQKAGGGAYGVGTILDVHMDPDGTYIVTKPALVAGVPSEVQLDDFVVANAAIATLFVE